VHRVAWSSRYAREPFDRRESVRVDTVQAMIDHRSCSTFTNGGSMTALTSTSAAVLSARSFHHPRSVDTALMKKIDHLVGFRLAQMRAGERDTFLAREQRQVVTLGIGGFTPGKFAQSDMANHFARC